MDAHRGSGVDWPEIWGAPRGDRGRRTAGEARADAAENAECAYQRDPEAIERWQRETYPAIARQAKAQGADILFWDESGFRADTVHGKTWGVRGQTPVVQRPGQRQSFSAASAANANGAFWFCTYDGALNADLFIVLRQQLMKYRRKPVHLVLDSLPAHKKAIVRDYVAATQGKLTLHFLPGDAPDLNPDELVWSHVKRTGIARRPLQQGEKLREKIEEQLARLQRMPQLVRSFSASFRRRYCRLLSNELAGRGIFKLYWRTVGREHEIYLDAERAFSDGEEWKKFVQREPASTSAADCVRHHAPSSKSLAERALEVLPNDWRERVQVLSARELRSVREAPYSGNAGSQCLRR